MISTETSDPDVGPDEPGGPVEGWRLRFYQACWWIAVVLMGRLYFPGGVEGRENLPAEGPYILAPVHRSYVDWLVVARVTRRRLRYIVKDSIWKVKAVGRVVELLGAFPVHRGVADREAFTRAAGVLEGGEPLVLFPEGARKTGPVVEPLLDGAAYLALRTGVPVVPVGIGGSERRMPKGAAFPRPGRVHIVVGSPILPADFVPSDRLAGADKRPGQSGDDSLPGSIERGADTTAEPTEPQRHSRRVSRSAAKRMSATLHDEIQGCFDRGQAHLGLPVAAAGGTGVPPTEDRSTDSTVGGVQTTEDVAERSSATEEGT